MELLLFMSRGGTCLPTLDFKTLYSLFENDYQVAVVEKAGYGFSDISDIDRSIDTILFETREALNKAGIHDQYILFPHSMSGIEALYWANKYPDEVKELYRVIFYRRTETTSMLNEVKCIKENAKKLESIDTTNVPMLFFASNGEETGYSKDEWRKFIIDYINNKQNGEYKIFARKYSFGDVKRIKNGRKQ